MDTALKHRLTASVIIGNLITIALGTIYFGTMFTLIRSRPRPTADPATQERRADAIAKAQELGVLVKVDDPDGDFCDVWVGAKFYVIPYADKAAIIGTVWAYNFEKTEHESVTAVRVRDDHSGKEIGLYFAKHLQMK